MKTLVTLCPKSTVAEALRRLSYQRRMREASSFVRFKDFLPGGPALPRRYIALRHDTDFAPSLLVGDGVCGIGTRGWR